jgi:hypothetical protein
MLIASRSCQPRGAGRLARRQAAGIAQGTLIAAGSPPFPLRASILRWNRSDEAKLYSVRPDTWQPRIASNCAGAHRFERRPSRMAFRLVDPPGSSRRFCPPPETRVTDFGGRPIPMAVCARRSLPGSGENSSVQVALRQWRFRANRRRRAAAASPGGPVEFHLR